MQVAIIGSGGREHALAWKFSCSPSVEKVFVLPGNPGMSKTCEVELVPCDPLNNQQVIKLCQQYQIDLVIIGAEAPLANGLADQLERAGFNVFGPSQAAARLESSKIFAKNFMDEMDIPTAKYQSFDSYSTATAALEKWDFSCGVVIKADGLASGKGVVITHDLACATNTLHNLMENSSYPIHASSVVIEEFLNGKEASIFALCDGENYHLLGHACDYKRLNDGDQGPNTEGMGCYYTPNWPTANHYQQIEEKIIKPTLTGMKRRGTPFKGVLFLGVMIDGESINLLEYNVRLGDPETQTLLPLLSDDLPQQILAAAQGRLSSTPTIKPPVNCSLHVVLASGGYPGVDGTPMELNNPIRWKVPTDYEVNIFFAGVSENPQADLVNSGGRILGVTATANSLAEARLLAYQQLAKVSCSGTQWRKDIGELL